MNGFLEAEFLKQQDLMLRQTVYHAIKFPRVEVCKTTLKMVPESQVIAQVLGGTNQSAGVVSIVGPVKCEELIERDDTAF